MARKAISRKSVLQNKEIIKPCFSVPTDTQPGEYWAGIPENEYTIGIKNTYKISNYGRILNASSGKVLHVYQRLGFQYVTLGMENRYKAPGQGNIDRRNFTVADLILHTFRPISEDTNALDVSPEYLGDRGDVYVDKLINGKLESNIRWIYKENSMKTFYEKIPKSTVHKICQLFEWGWSINRVCLEMENVLPRIITDIYRRRIYLDIVKLYDF